MFGNACADVISDSTCSALRSWARRCTLCSQWVARFLRILDKPTSRRVCDLRTTNPSHALPSQQHKAVAAISCLTLIMRISETRTVMQAAACYVTWPKVNHCIDRVPPNSMTAAPPHCEPCRKTMHTSCKKGDLPRILPENSVYYEPSGDVKPDPIVTQSHPTQQGSHRC